MILHVSREVIKKKLLSLEAMNVKTRNGKEVWSSKGRTYLIDNEPQDIVARFNTEIRGFYNYYSIANNASALGRSFGCIMRFSMLKTFAQKLNSSVRTITDKYREDDKFVVGIRTRKANANQEYSTMRASSVLPTWELKNVTTYPTCSTLQP